MTSELISHAGVLGALVSYTRQKGTELFRPLFFCSQSVGTRNGTHLPQHQKLPLENYRKTIQKLWGFHSPEEKHKEFSIEDLNSKQFLHLAPHWPTNSTPGSPILVFFKLKREISSVTGLGMLFARCEGVSSCPCGSFRNEEGSGPALPHPEVLLPLWELSPGSPGFATHENVFRPRFLSVCLWQSISRDG